MKRRHRIVQWMVTSALGDNNPLRHVHTVLANDFNTVRIAMFETYDNVWYAPTSPACHVTRTVASPGCCVRAGTVDSSCHSS